jgi:hypothetical protein
MMKVIPRMLRLGGQRRRPPTLAAGKAHATETRETEVPLVPLVCLKTIVLRVVV